MSVDRPLRIAVASGKGGTGKTTVATNLAVAMAEEAVDIAYVDCDVEEPNGHIFLKPSIQGHNDVSVLVPEVDRGRCSLCGACGTACRFSAIAVLPREVLTFPKLCHSCGGCTLACSESAIREVRRTTGVVETGTSGPVSFIQGRLNIGEAMAPPVIRAVIRAAPADRVTILDAPPGTSCPVIESLKTADVVLLVTEPTPFGLNDLRLAVDMVRELGLPFGVAINRSGCGDNGVSDYCETEQIPVLLELPNDRLIAQAYSRGELALQARPDIKPHFISLYGKLSALAQDTAQRSRRMSSQVLPASTESAALPSEVMLLGRRHDVRELVVVSGKGGTGKTSIVASLCALAEQATAADCDVDAANLHLILSPEVQHRWTFSGGKIAAVDVERCIGCGECVERCRFEAIQPAEPGGTSIHRVDALACEGCGVCVDTCPESAIALTAVTNGEWFVSKTRFGPLIHARLGIAQENTGKLVSLVRREAKALSMTQRRGLLIADGSPGIGCPVIASIAGATLVLIVTEPTLSGLHDLKRALELCGQFNVATAICINKADTNLDISVRIEEEARARRVPVLGRIRYDESVTRAQVRGVAVVENGDSLAATDLRALWNRTRIMLT